jgi:uncharacterized protein DUF4157
MTRATALSHARVGCVDDLPARRAASIADALVSNHPVNQISSATAHSVQRKCSECEAEQAPVRRQAAAPPSQSSDRHASADAAASAVGRGGTPLTPEQRAYFEPRFARDLSAVRIHTHGPAAAAAQRIGARAYAFRSNIAFAPGEFAPGRRDGDRLLAHELCHVVQQDASGRHAGLIQRAAEDGLEDDTSFSKEPVLPYAGHRKDTKEYADDLMSLPETDAKAEILDIEDIAFLYELEDALSSSELQTEEQQSRHRVLRRTLTSQINYIGGLKDIAEAERASDLLAKLIAKMELGQFEQITSDHLANLRPVQLEIVEDRTDEIAGEATKQGRRALDFQRYTLIPHLQRRAGRKSRFSPETGEAVREFYTTRTKGGFKCLAVVHKGLKAMLPEDIVTTAAQETVREGMAIRKARRKKGMTRKGDIVHGTITLSRFMNKLEKQGFAGPPTISKFEHKTKKWKPDPQEHILKLSKTEEPGWYFFAVNMHSFHTGILAVDRTDVAAPKIFWLDQFAGVRREKTGFNREITGKIGEVFRSFEPHFGFADSTIWQILIPPEVADQECVVEDNK